MKKTGRKINRYSRAKCQAAKRVMRRTKILEVAQVLPVLAKMGTRVHLLQTQQPQHHRLPRRMTTPTAAARPHQHQSAKRLPDFVMTTRGREQMPASALILPRHYRSARPSALRGYRCPTANESGSRYWLRQFHLPVWPQDF